MTHANSNIGLNKNSNIDFNRQNSLPNSSQTASSQEIKSVQNLIQDLKTSIQVEKTPPDYATLPAFKDYSGADAIQAEIDKLTQERNFVPNAKKGEYAQRIQALQVLMINDIAVTEGHKSADPGSFAAVDKFLQAFTAVVKEAERYNQTGEYREDFSTQVLENLQDSMDKELLSLVGTSLGDYVQDQVKTIGANLSQENIDFINKYTGLENIVLNNYEAQLDIGDKGDFKNVTEIQVEAGNQEIWLELSSTKLNYYKEALASLELQLSSARPENKAAIESEISILNGLIDAWSVQP